MSPVHINPQRVGGQPGSLGLPPDMLPGRLTFPSGTRLYPLKCRGPGTVGLELEERQEARQKGRQAQQHSRV